MTNTSVGRSSFVVRRFESAERRKEQKLMERNNVSLENLELKHVW